MLRNLLFLCGALITNACGVLGNNVEVPIHIETPQQNVNIDEQVTAFETALCTDTAATSFKAFCDEEIGSAACTPPQLPPAVDTSVEVPGQGAVTFQDFRNSSGLNDSVSLIFAIPVDIESLASELPAEEEIQDVGFGNIVLNFTSNTFNFDIPALDVYVLNRLATSEELKNIPLLLSLDDVKKIGAVGEDIDGDYRADRALEQGQTGQLPLYFAEGGNRIFNDALKQLHITLMMVVPAQYDIFSVLEEDGRVTIPKGALDVSLETTLTYRVNAGKLATAGN